MVTEKKTRRDEGVTVRGFFRLKIGEGNSIVGDSGWVENTIVNDGFDQYICRSLGAVAGSKTIAYVNLGTGTAPNATHTTLHGETGTRKTTSNSVVASKTLQMTAAFDSTDHPGGTPSIGNVGLFNAVSSGTLFSGNTFGSSAWNSNQSISLTYQIKFS